MGEIVCGDDGFRGSSFAARLLVVEAELEDLVGGGADAAAAGQQFLAAVVEDFEGILEALADAVVFLEEVAGVL